MTKVLANLLRTSALAALLALILVAPAGAAKQCWEKVLDDWVDNERIDRTYAIHCYTEAIRNAPEDIGGYSNFDDEVRRARAAAIGKLNPPGPGAPAATDPGAPPPAEPSKPAPPQTEPERTPAGPPDDGTETDESGILGTSTDGPDGGTGPINEAIDALGSDDASSVPLTLIILTVVAGLLAAGAATSLIARRIQLRRARAAEPLPPGPPPGRPPAA